MSTKIFDLGWCMARLNKAKHSLVIVSPSQEAEHSYTPAESVCVYGEQAMITLRDALLELYPVDA